MHRGLTAHARARYRCFLPDLAGLAGVRRVRPMPDLNHSSIRKLAALAATLVWRRRLAGFCGNLASAFLRRIRALRACDFWCKNLRPRPSLLVSDVEQWLSRLVVAT